MTFQRSIDFFICYVQHEYLNLNLHTVNCKICKWVIFIAKPLCLCVSIMCKKGLEIDKVYPNILHQEIINEIALKSMPLGAKEGDFTTVTLSDKKIFSGLIFTVPHLLTRDNIASIIAVFESMSYNAEILQENFTLLVRSLKESNVISSDKVTDLLPELFEGIKLGKFDMNIKRGKNVAFDFSNLEAKFVKKDKIKEFTSDVWG